MPMPRTALSRGNIKQRSIDWSGNSIQGTKMKISFRERFKAWLFEDSAESYTTKMSDKDGPVIEMDNSINFSVVNATGGRIVQVRHYDQKSDRHRHSLHIITPEEDLATALAHILVIDHLSR
jgi:hypothetical protein